MNSLYVLVVAILVLGLTACEGDKKFVAQDPGSSVQDLSTDAIDIVPDQPIDPTPTEGGDPQDKPPVQPGQDPQERPEDPGKPPKQQGTIIVDVIDEGSIKDGLRALAEDCLSRLKAGEVYECDLTTVSGEDGVTFAIANPPAGLTIDPATGLIHWATTEDQVGRHVLDVVTMQGQYNTVTQLTVDVFENSPPLFSELDCETEVAVGVPWECQVVAHDQDSDPLTYTLTRINGQDPPDGMTIDEDGLITWTPQADDFGWDNVIIEVSDGRDEDTLEQPIHVYDPNNPPVLEFVDCAQTADEDTWYECGYVIVDDSIPDEMSLWLEDFPEGMLFDREAQTVSWQVTNVETATQVNYTVVMDVLGVEHRERNYLIALPMNDPPTLRYLDCVTDITEDATYRCSYEADDPDGDQVFVSLDDFPAGMTLDEAANRVSWRAANAIEPMEVSYVLTVSDGRLSGTYPNTVTVLPVNDAPAVRFENCAGSADEDELYTCDVLPMDIDGDDVVITLLDGPAGMVFEDDTISWQVPNVLEQETQTFTLLLDDGLAQVEVPRSVTLLPVNDAPTLVFDDCAVEANEDTIYSCSFTLEDIDGDLVTASLDGGPLGMSLDLVNHRVFYPVPNVRTAHDIIYYIVLDDGQEQPRFQQTFEVLPVNDAPTFRFVSCADRVLEDATFVCTYETEDLDGDAVTVSLATGPAGMTVDQAQNRIVWTVPNTLAETEVPFSVTVGDGTVQQDYGRSVIAVPVNDAPTLTFSNCPATIDEDQQYTCSVQVADIDGDALTWFVVGGPTGMIAEPANQRVLWNVPNTLTPTTITYEVVVQDGVLETRATQTVQALPVNDRPTIALLDCPAAVDEDEVFTCYYEVGDLDGNPVTVSLADGPSGMSLDTLNRRVSYLVPNTLTQTRVEFVLVANDETGTGTAEAQTGGAFDALPVNDAPTITFQNCTTTVLENAAYVCNYTVVDLDENPVTVSLSGQPGGMTLDTVNRRIAWTVPDLPNDPVQQDFSFDVLVGDGTVTVTVERPLIAVAVNDAPLISFNDCVTSIDEDQLYTCGYTLTDNDTPLGNIAVTMLAAPAGMTLNTTTRQVTWTVPNIVAQHAESFTLAADDGENTTTATQSVLVVPVNDAPAITLGPCAQTVNEDAAYTCTYTTSDLDGDTLTVTLIGGPVGMTLDTVNRRVSWTAPNTLLPTEYSYQLEVSDGTAQTRAGTRFTVQPMNDAPTIVLNCPNPDAADEDETYSCTYQLTDIDGNTVTVSLIGAPAWLQVDGGANRLTGTVPNILTQQTVNYTVRISDGTVNVESSRSLVLNPQNDAPVLSFGNCPASIAEDQQYLCPYTATDPDGTTPTVTLSGAPDWLTVDAANSRLIGTVPNTLAQTTLTFQVTASDGQAQTTRDRSVVLLPVNDPPTIVLVSCPATVAEDAAYSCTYETADLDNEPVTVSWVSGPAWMTLDTVNRRVTGTAPNVTAETPYSFTLTARDAASETRATGTVRVTPENDPPTLTFGTCPTTIVEKAQINGIWVYSVFRCDFTVSDPDGTTPTVALAGPSGMILTNGNRRVEYTVPEVAADSPVNFTLTVGDGVIDVPYPRSFTILNVNAAPVLAAIGNRTAVELVPLVLTLSATDPDAGQTLTYTVTGLPGFASFNAGTRILTFSPQPGHAGVYSGITATVSDGSATDSETFSLTVDEAGPQDATNTVDLQGNASLKVDILFVLDTSGSMDYVASGISDFLGDFLAQLDEHLDFQIALLLAHSSGDWSGRLYNYGTAPKILKKINYQNLDGSVNVTALQAAFAMNFEHYVSGQPDGGEAGLYSYNKAVVDLLGAPNPGSVAGIETLREFFRQDATLNVIWLADENDVCYRYGINSAVTYTSSDINWLCTNHRTHVDFFGQDTDNSNECSSYFSLCFNSATPVLQRHPAARTTTAETIYSNTVALKGDRPVSMSGIIFRDMDNPALYPGLGLNGENQTGRGYKEAIKVSLGNPDLDDLDEAFLGHVVDMLEIKTGAVDFSESMVKLGAVAGSVAVDVTLDHEPIPETLAAFIMAVNGVPLAEPVEISVQPKDGEVVSVVVPSEYYFDALQLRVDYQYLP